MKNISSQLNVLFLCTHNSGRSIMAEALLNHVGKGRFKAFSAGSNPVEAPHPLALGALQRAGVSIEGLNSKSWDVFGKFDAPHMDLVITVCDDAAGMVCPIWPGPPAVAHWGMPDPSSSDVAEVDREEAFRKSLHLIARRLDLLVNLPIERLTKLTLEQHVLEIARH
jgi:arsenate reductase